MSFLRWVFFVFFALRWVSQGEVVKCQMYKNKTALGHCIVTLVPFCVGFLSNSDSVIFFRLEIRYLNVYRYRVNLYIFFCIKTVAFIDLINGRHWMWGGCWGEQHRFYFIFNQCFDRRSHLVKIWTKFIRTRSMGPGFSKSHSLSITLKETFCNLTDVTLADEDTNSILTDQANRAFKGMRQCKWHNRVAYFGMHVNSPDDQILNWFAKHCQRHNGPRVLSW